MRTAALTKEETEEIARGFVDEYLQRAPEFLDVVEFAEEWLGVDEADEDPMGDDDYQNIYIAVTGLLDDEAQRFADADS